MSPLLPHFISKTWLSRFPYGSGLQPWLDAIALPLGTFSLLS